MRSAKDLRTIPFLKFHTVMGGLLGLVLGIIYAIGGLIIDTLVSLGWIDFPGTPGLSEGTLLAMGALIGMPLIFGVLGLGVGIVELVLFKVFKKYLVRLEINFEKMES